MRSDEDHVDTKETARTFPSSILEVAVEILKFYDFGFSFKCHNQDIWQLHWFDYLNGTEGGGNKKKKDPEGSCKMKRIAQLLWSNIVLNLHILHPWRVHWP